MKPGKNCYKTYINKIELKNQIEVCFLKKRCPFMKKTMQQKFTWSYEEYFYDNTNAACIEPYSSEKKILKSLTFALS